MKRIRLFLFAAALFAAASLAGASRPLWLRYPSLSPDGTTVVFAYGGDLYTVASTGGAARQLTRHESRDYMPVWSPDGKYIAFAADRFGNFDIFLIAASGGEARRLTAFSGTETPYCFTPDGKSVVFGAKIQAPAQSAAFPHRAMSELYKAPVDGGRTELLLATPAENVCFARDGKGFVFQDRKGVENTWRKHHTSSVTRDIWRYDLENNRYTQLIGDPGEDTNPVLSPDQSTVYFLSERSGSYNVHAFPVDQPSKVRQVTHFKTHPVRFLSIADNGTLCFGYDGEVYTLPAKGKPQRLDVQIVEEARNNATLDIRAGAVAQAVSADGKQIASVMRGEIFVSSVDYRYTKRITSSAAQDAMPSFAPDGKSLVYASEKSGVWSLYVAKLARAEESYFFNATLIDEEPLLTPSDTERTHPKYSPDGKEIAFIEDRHPLKVYTIDTKKIRTITDGSGNPNSSGSIDYEWSPDGKWFTLAYVPNRHEPYSDIGLVSATGGEPVTNLTNSGYTDSNPRWVMNGNAILFQSERYGMRNHASWGSLNDVMIVFMNQKTFDKFRLSDDDYQLLLEEEKAGKKKETNAKTDSTKNAKDIEIELANIEDRILRLTPNSANLGDAVLTNEGDKLYYQASFEKGYDLWSINTRTRETKLEIKDAGRASLLLDKDGKELFQLGRSPQKITLAGGKRKSITITARMDLDLAAEREYMFDHVYTQELKRFYTPAMHGADWSGLKKAYAKFLPHVKNNYDFAELLSELLGELNTSHTGSQYYPQAANADATAALGLLFSCTDARDNGLLIDEVLEKGPLAKATGKVKAGHILEAINGKKIEAGQDYFPLLNKTAGQPTLLSFYNPDNQERWEEVIKPITQGEQQSLLYRRWVKQREADVERLSGGRLGYVHIESMGDPSFRSIYSDILGKFNNKEGIVIDTRFNGGGRLHEDLEILFSGRKYFTQVIRGIETCDMPSRRWNKPSIMLVGEANYSNAHGSPWVYRHANIGKLVGMPVAGTMTSVSWETLQDPSLVFGIPIVGYRLADGSYLENQQLEPDIKVANDPARLAQGEDRQLATAVSELLKDLP